MDKHQITRPTRPDDEPIIAKSTAITDQRGKSGGRAARTPGLTSGDLRGVAESRLRSSQGDPTAAQKSADDIVGGAIR
jgi:hypothetical protein